MKLKHMKLVLSVKIRFIYWNGYLGARGETGSAYFITTGTITKQTYALLYKSLEILLEKCMAHLR